LEARLLSFGDNRYQAKAHPQHLFVVLGWQRHLEAADVHFDVIIEVQPLATAIEQVEEIAGLHCDRARHFSSARGKSERHEGDGAQFPSRVRKMARHCEYSWGGHSKTYFQRLGQ